LNSKSLSDVVDQRSKLNIPLLNKLPSNVSYFPFTLAISILSFKADYYIHSNMRLLVSNAFFSSKLIFINENKSAMP